MPLTLAQLLAGKTLDAQRAELLAGLPPSFPVTAWQAGSVPLTLIEIDAEALTDLDAKVVAVAAGGFLDTATGAWLDLLADSRYDELRKPAVVTQGYVVLTSAAGVGPIDITAGQLIFRTASGLRYRNTQAGTIPLANNLVMQVEAESPGAAYNVAILTITTMLTPIPGVTVTNPIYSGSSWISRQGADVETDAALRQRCRDKWATLGVGATEAAYRYWALASAAEVRRAVAFESSTLGEVTVIVAGASGPVGIGTLPIVQAYIDARRPLAVQVAVGNAELDTQAVAGTITTAPGYAVSALAAAQVAASAYADEIPIGGRFSLGELIERIQGVAGVLDVALTSPAVSFILDDAHVLGFTYAGLDAEEL